jgi:hypothetical protein
MSSHLVLLTFLLLVEFEISILIGRLLLEDFLKLTVIFHIFLLVVILQKVLYAQPEAQVLSLVSSENKKKIVYKKCKKDSVINTIRRNSES